ncbi:amino acid ABC transporter permease [Pseudomonas fragariae (ex Marin et al. 2024)]|uniref:amino acid ABC transporter permease n=1 Tax=Pseudomonas TaxID=286 RepID=UPI0004189044|nr:MULTISPECIES: amino acid ABC transporter permease [Pseudomonas]KWS09713.1 amino acid ABC transporter permease [Pseudomonas syringae pv. syringae]MCA5973809.1 amino acid ABC transporter permease [Pseudomonas sp. P135]MCH5535870.1 amino acid ABC transporter permease [Pseudomonas syringae pv. syringae]MCH5553337.1 amino acid ABC transporter permease [Pseudomonas syringae pv. syringae]MCH5572166.1 amino acid ABC transporter permease [Pseudomonas syringae pv. syringae]
MFDVFTIVRDNWTLLLVGQYPHGPMGGLISTLMLAALALLLAFPLGLLLSLARVSPWRWLRYPATVWVYVMRGIPLLMVIFWTYFLVPLLIGHNITGFTTMLCTLVVYQSAYLCEIIRGAIQALPTGQYEASRALGMGYMRTTVWVILPQALYNALPSLISQFISIIKETSLGYVINVQEVTFAANQINNQLLTKPFQVFFILAITYYVLCYGLTRFAAVVEQRIARKREGDVSPVPVARPLTTDN